MDGAVFLAGRARHDGYAGGQEVVAYHFEGGFAAAEQVGKKVWTLPLTASKVSLKRSLVLSSIWAMASSKRVMAACTSSLWLRW